MDDYINIKQRNINISKKELLDILTYEDNDIVFLSGSLIEGSINQMSEGMGNRLSDIDVFVLADNMDIYKSNSDYDWEYFKIQFKRLYGISIDIEIYSKEIMLNLIMQLNKVNFDDDIRLYNILKMPAGIDLTKFTSFVHRFLNAIPIFNENEYYNIKNNLNQKNYYKLMIRQSINLVDINYEDICGNIEIGQYEVANYISKNILIETMKAYIFFNKTSLDRDKWVIMKLHNLAKCDERSSEIYKKFKFLYFEQSLTDGDSLKKNAEKILDFSNDVINIIGMEGDI